MHTRRANRVPSVTTERFSEQVAPPLHSFRPSLKAFGPQADALGVFRVIRPNDGEGDVDKLPVAQLSRQAHSHRQKKPFERALGCHALVLQQDMVQDLVVLQLQPRRAGEPVNLVAGVRLSAIPDWDAERLQPLKEVVFPRRGPQLDLRGVNCSGRLIRYEQDYPVASTPVWQLKDARVVDSAELCDFQFFVFAI